MKRKIIITMKNTRRLTAFCLTGALTLAASGGALAAGNDAALQALFAQANYWHEKSHDELAMESLAEGALGGCQQHPGAVSDGALVAAGRRYAGGGAVARAAGESGP